MITIRQALEQGILTLTQAGQAQARLDAQVLLSHVLNVERSTLYAYPERTLTPAEEQHYLTLIERRSQGEPVAYLTGQKQNCWLKLRSTPASLCWQRDALRL